MVSLVGDNWCRYDNLACLACPFNMNDISENVQNLGCLPTPFEIMDFKIHDNWNWECHEGTGKVCSGFVAVCKDKNLDYKSGILLDADYYLRTGSKRPKITHSESK